MSPPEMAFAARESPPKGRKIRFLSVMPSNTAVQTAMIELVNSTTDCFSAIVSSRRARLSSAVSVPHLNPLTMGIDIRLILPLVV